MTPYLKAQEFVNYHAKQYELQLYQLNIKLGSSLSNENSIYQASEYIG